jgi:CRISPR/Cas system-associated protein Cas7 (RAMP superfamily)
VDLTPILDKLGDMEDEVNQAYENVRPNNSVTGYLYLIDASGVRTGMRRKVQYASPNSDRIVKVFGLEPNP